MNTRKILWLMASHAVVAGAGFMGGIYTLPILLAPKAPSTHEISAATVQPLFTAQFRRDLKDSDLLHWGEGVVTIAPRPLLWRAGWLRGPTTSSTSLPSLLKQRPTSSA